MLEAEEATVANPLIPPHVKVGLAATGLLAIGGGKAAIALGAWSASSAQAEAAATAQQLAAKQTTQKITKSYAASKGKSFWLDPLEESPEVVQWPESFPVFVLGEENETAYEIRKPTRPFLSRRDLD